MSMMRDEIFSEPCVLVNTINNNLNTIKAIAEEVKKRNINNIETVGRGSSDNASICFKYATEILSGFPVMEFHPSVITMYKSEVKLSNNLVIAISQSGKSIDTLAVLNHSKKSGALTVALTNDATSPLAKAAHYHLDLSCGEEFSVAATKTFVAQLVVLYMLSIALSDKDLMPVIFAIPDKIQQVLDNYENIKELAKSLINDQNTIILTRGIMQGIGKELSLKYQECCYNLSHFFSINDFMHGPLAIVDENTNVLIIAPASECSSNFTDMAVRLKLLGAKVTTISDIKELNQSADAYLEMPSADMLTASIIYATAGHLLVTELAILRGINPDAPRNLKKVTITK